MPARVLALTDVDGVFGDFDRAEGGTPLEALDPASFAALREKLTSTTGVDVTGGMVEKVEKLLALAAASPASEIRICNGLDPASVRDAVLGRFQGGTRIRPAS